MGGALLFLVLRVVVAPLSIGPLRPYVMELLNSRLAGYAVEMDDAAIAWGGFTQFLDLHALEVRILDPQGVQVAEIPQISLGINPLAALIGDVVPRRLVLHGLSARLVRSEDGSFRLSERIAERSENGRFLLALIQGLSQVDAGADGGEGVLSELEGISVVEAVIEIEDVFTGRIWHLSAVQLDFARTRTGLLLGLTGELDVDGRTGHVEAAGTRDAASGETDISMVLWQIVPAWFAAEFGTLRGLRGVETPVSGNLNLSLAADGTIKKAGFKLAILNGLLDLAGTLPGPVQVERAALEGELDRLEGVLTLSHFALEADGATFDGEAKVYLADASEGIHLASRFSDLPVRLLVNLWPVGLKESARGWIDANITDGVLKSGTAKLDITPEQAAEDILPGDVLALEFEAENFVIHYLRPMPPVRGLSGHGTLSAAGLDITLTGGQVLDSSTGLNLSASPIILKMTNFNLPIEHIADISVSFQGTASDVVNFLDYKPLGYSSGYGVAPNDLTGAALLKARFKFPLIQALKLEQLDISVSGTLSDVGFPGFLAAGDALGAFSVDVDNDGLAARGVLGIFGVEANVEWLERFSAPAGASTTFRVSADLESTVVETILGSLPVPVAGRIGLHAELLGAGFNVRDGSVTLDLKEAELASSVLGWSKPSGVPAHLGVTFSSEDGRLTDNTLSLQGGGLSAVGDVALGTGGRFEGLRFSKLAYGETDVVVSARPMGDGRMMVRISGPSLDGKPILDALFRGGQEGSSANAEVDVSVDRVIGHESEPIRGFEGVLRLSEGRMSELHLTGQLRDGDMVIGFDNDSGQGQLFAYSDDAGSLARAVGLFSNGVGGRLSAKATVERAGGKSVTKGRAAISDVRVVHAPGFAKVLGIGSLTGIRDSLSGQGVKFDRVRVGFEISEAGIVVEDAQAIGPSLGIKIAGHVSPDLEHVALRGTLVPSYTINSFFGRLPILGQIITGGENEGLIALRFTMDGPTDDPDVTVNPLSALTPGILRNIFSIFEGPVRPAADAKPVDKPADKPAEIE